MKLLFSIYWSSALQFNVKLVDFPEEWWWHSSSSSSNKQASISKPFMNAFMSLSHKLLFSFPALLYVWELAVVGFVVCVNIFNKCTQVGVICIDACLIWLIGFSMHWWLELREIPFICLFVYITATNTTFFWFQSPWYRCHSKYQRNRYTNIYVICASLNNTTHVFYAECLI